jgi:hypothetical protein
MFLNYDERKYFTRLKLINVLKLKFELKKNGLKQFNSAPPITDDVFIVCCRIPLKFKRRKPDNIFFKLQFKQFSFSLNLFMLFICTKCF